MNIIEAYEALKQGKRVFDDEGDEAILCGKGMSWKISKNTVPFTQELIDGWTIIDIDDAPKKLEFEDCALTMHEDDAETFSYNGTSMYAEKAFRFSNFRGYLWRLKSGRVIESAYPVRQNPDDADSVYYGALDSSARASSWPIAERFAVRFEKR